MLIFNMTMYICKRHSGRNNRTPMLLNECPEQCPSPSSKWYRQKRHGDTLPVHAHARSRHNFRPAVQISEYQRHSSHSPLSRVPILLSQLFDLLLELLHVI